MRNNAIVMLILLGVVIFSIVYEYHYYKAIKELAPVVEEKQSQVENIILQEMKEAQDKLNKSK